MQLSFGYTSSQGFDTFRSALSGGKAVLKYAMQGTVLPEPQEKRASPFAMGEARSSFMA